MGGPSHYAQSLDASAYAGRSVGQERPGSVRIMTSHGRQELVFGAEEGELGLNYC